MPLLHMIIGLAGIIERLEYFPYHLQVPIVFVMGDMGFLLISSLPESHNAIAIRVVCVGGSTPTWRFASNKRLGDKMLRRRHVNDKSVRKRQVR